MTERPEQLYLYGKMMFTDRLVGTRYPNPEIIHLCRDDDGNVLMAVDSSLAVMNREEVRWLVSRLTAALDDWPVTG